MRHHPDHPTSYKSDKLAPRAGHAEGRGLFAKAHIQPGEVLVVWGGRVTPRHEFVQIEEDLRSISVQIEDDLFLVPRRPCGADRVNHSCDPNAGLRGSISLVARRHIQPGEEICYDYAMSDGSAYDEFECRCGAAQCRSRITGQDWRNTELWERYDGHFSPYLAARIDALRAEARRSSGTEAMPSN